MRRTAAVIVTMVLLLGLPIGSVSADPIWTGFGECPAPDLAAYQCGTLTVQLDRTPGSPDRRTIELSVLRAGNPHADRTLLYLTGGPGQPGPALAPRILPTLQAIAEDYRIIFLDQRGTGDHPLVCPKLQEERGTFDLLPPSRAAVLQCADILGPDRQHYSTTDTVADLEDLRVAIGVDAWAIDGVSYGTYTGQRYAAAHPERVTHLVLDSVVPVTSFDAQGVASFNEFARVLRDVCATPDRDCPSDPAADIRAILDADPHYGGRLFHLVTAAGYIDPDRLLELPEWLHAAVNGDRSGLDGFEAGLESFETPAQDYSQGIQASTLCADLTFPWGGADRPERVRDLLADRAAHVHSDAELFPFNAETARSNGEMQMCEWWPRVRDRKVPASELSLDGINALLLSGERDLGTPLHWARLAHKQIPGSRLIVVPDTGHGLQGTYSAINPTVADFLLS